MRAAAAGALPTQSPSHSTRWTGAVMSTMADTDDVYDLDLVDLKGALLCPGSAMWTGTGSCGGSLTVAGFL